MRMTSRHQGLSLTNPSRNPEKMKGMRSIIPPVILDIFHLSQSHNLPIVPTPKKEDISCNIPALITQKKNSPTFASLATNPFARNAPSTECIKITRSKQQGKPSSRSGDCYRKTSRSWIKRLVISWSQETRERSKVKSGVKIAEKIKSTSKRS